MWFALWMAVWIIIWTSLYLLQDAVFILDYIYLWLICNGCFLCMTYKNWVLPKQKWFVKNEKKHQWKLADMLIFSLLSGYNFAVFKKLCLFSGILNPDLPIITSIWCLFVSLVCFQVRIRLEQEGCCSAKMARVLGALADMAAILMSGTFLSHFVGFD